MEGKNTTGSAHPAVLILACSGAADVGAVADQAARKLTREGLGKMYCLAGIGGKVEAILSNALSSPKTVAIDGCGMNCTRMTLVHQNVPLHAHVNLASLGMEKGKSPATEENVEKAAAHIRALLADKGSR